MNWPQEEPTTLEQITRAEKKIDAAIQISQSILETLTNKTIPNDLEERFKSFEAGLKEVKEWMIEHKAVCKVENQVKSLKQKRNEAILDAIFKGAVGVIGALATVLLIWAIGSYFGIQLR